MVALILILSATLLARSQNPADNFDAAIRPIIQLTCAQCHNETMAAGGLNLKPMDRASLTSQRDVWEVVLRKLKAGEMPPPGTPKPAGLAAMAAALESELDRLDRNIPPDPGRITARRLNRTEYRNTIRDLTGVDFQVAAEFPADDTGEGFDNIADVLTTSPLLAEKYLAAAERISARALGLVRKPRPVSASYSADIGGGPLTGLNGVARRAGTSFIEVAHRVEYDGDYVIQAGLAGQRGPEGKPVTMGFWMDGALLYSEQVATTPPKSVFFSPYELKEFRLFLPEGLHSFRLGFINDEIGASAPRGKAFDANVNKFPQYVSFLGPEPGSPEPAGRKKILVCDPASGPACVERILSTFARRAYRRPVRPAEIASLIKVVQAAQGAGLSAEEGIQTGLTAILVSPNFLFRIERDSQPANASAVDPSVGPTVRPTGGTPASPAFLNGQSDGPPTPHRISDVELASRLSYFLWSSTPDDALVDLAEQGRLSTPAVLDAQMTRMLADPRSSALAENFAGQWLETRNLDSIKPDPEKFPEWNAELKEAMRAETRLFFDSILRENRPISEVLTARYTFLNERLARFYGIEGVAGPEFRRVDLPNSQRGGILSHASVLAVTSYPTRTSVVLRGKYILENILASPPPPPPPNVPPLDEEAVGAARSLRQQMEQHRANPSCAICHAKIDPLGFALENYDAIGKWRMVDANAPIDAAGALPDGSGFNGPAEFREALTRRLPQVAEALTRKMMVYALGRGLESYDRRTVSSIVRNWETKGYPMQSLIFEIVHSLSFQSRRGEP